MEEAFKHRQGSYFLSNEPKQQYKHHLTEVPGQLPTQGAQAYVWNSNRVGAKAGTSDMQISL